MKRFEDHFYHVTCLVLFNMVEIRDGKMELEGNLKHRNIMKMVMENEIKNECCEVCVKSGSRMFLMGMKIPCSYKDCNKSFHPICGYLYGCKFSLKKDKGNKL